MIPRDAAAYERVLRALPRTLGKPGARAAGALELVLAGVRGSRWPEVAWAFSHLTTDGFPLELVFSFEDDAVRYTAELGAPEDDPRGRVSAGAALLSRLRGGPASFALEPWERLQADAPLRYGAWLGGRHDAQGDRYKLYIEVPPDRAQADDLVRGHLGGLPFSHRPTPLRLVGIEPATGSLELYFRADRLEDWEVALLLRRVGLGSRQVEVEEVLAERCRRSVRPELPGGAHGFSFVGPPHAPPRALSLFMPAPAVLGADAHARRRLMDEPAFGGAGRELYRALFGDADRPPPRHGMASFVVPPGGAVEFRVGVQPV